MSISSVKTGAIGDSLLAGNSAYIPTAFESIATVNLGGTTTGSFTSISSIYQHLQIRAFNKRDAGALSYGRLRINGDTGSNYAWHRLIGNGSSASADSSTSTSFIRLYSPDGDSSTFNSIIIDIQDYASTSKYKTVRILYGHDLGAYAGNSYVVLESGLWMNTAAITSISYDIAGDTFATSSTMALYGIKG